MARQMNIERVNYYQSIHKTLRRLLFLFSIEMGKADFSCKQTESSLLEQFYQLKNYLNSHAVHEEEFFHPFIYESLPNHCHCLEEQHADHEIALEKIQQIFNEIQQTFEPLEKQNLVRRQYLLINRFVANYLLHLDDEENIIMPLLWEKCDDETLIKPLQKLLESMSKEDLKNSLEVFLPALNPFEKRHLLRHIES